MANEEVVGIVDLDVNLAEVEPAPELPIGTYRGEIVGVQTATSAKGNNYWNIQIKIPPAEIPAELAEFYEDGATFYWNRQLIPNGKDRRVLVNLRKFIEAIGLDSNVTQVDPNEWMGREVGVVLKMGKDLDGNPRAEPARLEAVATKPAPKGGAGKRR